MSASLDTALPRPPGGYGLELPEWGPYSKYYDGICRILNDPSHGMVEFFCVIGYVRGKLVIPDASFDCGYHPWQALDDLSVYGYRYELAGRGREYADVQFFGADADSALLGIRFVNSAEHDREYVCSVFAVHRTRPCVEVRLGAGDCWIGAEGYAALEPRGRSPDALRLHAGRRGIVLRSTSSTREIAVTSMRLASAELASFGLGDELSLRVREVEPEEEQPVFVLDGILLSDERNAAGLRFAVRTDAPRFEAYRPSGRHGVELRSTVVPDLRIALFSEDERPIPPPPYSDATITHVFHADLSGDVQRKLANDSLVNWDAFNCVISGDGSNHYAGYNIAPVVVPANGTREVFVGLACVRHSSALSIAEGRYRGRLASRRDAEERCASRACRVPDGPHRFSQELTMAQLLLNVTYPQYVEDGFVIGATPAKRWSDNALWDAGMHAIGLAAYAPERALREILAYTTEHQLSAWSVFPIHILAFDEIHQASRDPERLAFFYPRLRRVYEELLGRGADPGYARLASGLLFDKGGGAYGMDDYPAKFAVARYGKDTTVASADTSAYAIRAAKTLRLLARELGRDSDIPGYESDIARLSAALQRYSWDEASGYYAYVRHDAMERLYYDRDHSWNMGLDGVAPLAAGICTPDQRARLLGHLLTDGELWSPHGLLPVAANAPYFRRLGYWNGKVWMPYQWIFWKTLLGEGEAEGAERIALTALRLWRDAVDDTWNCFELFDAMTGMGEGAHQFAGLSSPIVSFHRAYLVPGTVTVGFDTRLVSRQYDEATGALRCSVCAPYRAGRTTVLAALRASGTHEVAIGGVRREVNTSQPWIALPVDLAEPPTEIVIRPLPESPTRPRP